MKTLLLHPTDSSTAFLSDSYLGKGYTVVNDPFISKSKLKELIKSHDKVVMMGHGSPKGLFSSKGFLIDSSYVYLLKDKLCLGVWCHADHFFSKYKLNGYGTGMVVSEADEADYWGLNWTLSDVNESNALLTESLKVALDSSDFAGTLKNLYEGDSDVVKFNKGNM